MRLRINTTFELTNEQAAALVLLSKRMYPDEDITNETAVVRFLLEDAVHQFIYEETTKQRCRVCGCTDDWACDEGCFWVKKGLCSVCALKTESEAAHA